MQPSKVVPQSRILSFHTSHVGLADNLVFIRNKHRIDLPSVCDVEEALPYTDNRPQRLKYLRASITDYPPKYAWPEVVYGCPDPDFIFFEPTNV